MASLYPVLSSPQPLKVLVSLLLSVITPLVRGVRVDATLSVLIFDAWYAQCSEQCLVIGTQLKIH